MNESARSIAAMPQARCAVSTPGLQPVHLFGATAGRSFRCVVSQPGRAYAPMGPAPPRPLELPSIFQPAQCRARPDPFFALVT